MVSFSVDGYVNVDISSEFVVVFPAVLIVVSVKFDVTVLFGLSEVGMSVVLEFKMVVLYIVLSAGTGLCVVFSEVVEAINVLFSEDSADVVDVSVEFDAVKEEIVSFTDVVLVSPLFVGYSMVVRDVLSVELFPSGTSEVCSPVVEKLELLDETSSVMIVVFVRLETVEFDWVSVRVTCSVVSFVEIRLSILLLTLTVSGEFVKDLGTSVDGTVVFSNAAPTEEVSLLLIFIVIVVNGEIKLLMVIFSVGFSEYLILVEFVVNVELESAE